jgi:hypothetical protein
MPGISMSSKTKSTVICFSAAMTSRPFRHSLTKLISVSLDNSGGPLIRWASARERAVFLSEGFSCPANPIDCKGAEFRHQVFVGHDIFCDDSCAFPLELYAAAQPLRCQIVEELFD